MERIRKNSWSSDFTKMNVLPKVARMRQLVGYPDWLTNGTKVDEKFQKVDSPQTRKAIVLQCTQICLLRSRFSQLEFGRNRVESLANFVHWESERNFNSLNLDPAGMRDL